MNTAIIAIKGNHLGNIDLIFDALNYVDARIDKHFENYTEFESYLYDNYNDLALNGIFIRGIWLENDWTILIDPDMADPVCEDALKIISQKLNTTVSGFLVEPTINSFVFAYFDAQHQRYFLMDDFYIRENRGTPIPEETGLNINESASEKDFIALANNLGFQLEPRDLKTGFTIKELRHTEAFKKEMEKFAPK